MRDIYQFTLRDKRCLSRIAHEVKPKLQRGIQKLIIQAQIPKLTWQYLIKFPLLRDQHLIQYMLFKKAISGITWLFIMRIFTKCIDIILNVLVIRHIEPSVYGLTTNLNFLTNLSLFYPKIILRHTYSRSQESGQLVSQSAINMMYIGWLITISIAPVVSLLMIFKGNSHDQEGFSFACIFFAISAIIEAGAEPYIVPNILQFQYKIIAQTESLSILSKNIVLYLLVNFLSVQPLKAFGIGSVTYSLMILAQFYFRNPKIRLCKLEKKQFILPEMRQVGKQFTIMATMKYLLSETEKIVMIYHDNPVITGEFTLISNIGALVPRFIYSSLEEVSFNLFPKLSPSDQMNCLQNLIKLVNLIGITILFAGLPCASTFLKIYGTQWSSESCIFTLQIYCIYVWIIGINGISESFVNSTIKVKDMGWYQSCLVVQTMIYLICLIIFVRFGSPGVAISNCISMLVRILLSTYIIGQTQAKSVTIRDVLPKYFAFYFFGLLLQFQIQGLLLLFITASYYGILGLLNLYKMRQDLKQFL